MQLIDLKRAQSLYSKFGTATEVSGGSGANTIYGLASLGIATSYIGKVKDDFLGHRFKSDLLNMNIHYSTHLSNKTNAAETGRCVVLITPDGERSMNTYLGVTEHLHETDIDIENVRLSEWLYLEGYRFDGPDSEKAFAKAIDLSTPHFLAASLADLNADFLPIGTLLPFFHGTIALLVLPNLFFWFLCVGERGKVMLISIMYIAA